MVTIVLESADADTKLTELMNQFCDESRTADTTEARALLKRSYEKVIRIAGVLAVWDCPTSPVISLEHVEWAEKVVRSSDQTLLDFAANNIYDNDELANAAKLIGVVGKIITGAISPKTKAHYVITRINSNWVARGSALKASKLTKFQFDNAVAHLVAVGSLGEGVYANTTTVKKIAYLFLDDA